MIVDHTGCLKPCTYNEYKLTGEIEHPAKNHPGYIGIWFPGKKVFIEKEVESYSFESLLSDIGGSLGLFLGFSLLMLWDAASTVVQKIINTVRDGVIYNYICH